MIIEEFKGGGEVEEAEVKMSTADSATNDEGSGAGNVEAWDAKRVVVGAGSRLLFYPTLLYNVVRNKMQTEFHWWDWVDEFILLGAVPFPTDVPRLRELGVRGVVTLNEPYETLVPTSLYHAFGIDHLVIPTRDYCFAPSLHDICQAVEFIHELVLRGKSNYVHCKAGRGRSTTIVLCYLVHHKHMTPLAAYNYVKSVRPRVRLASAQWQAVQEYYHVRVKAGGLCLNMTSLVRRIPRLIPSRELVAFDDGSVVVVTKADLDGYDPSHETVPVGSATWANLSVICRVRVAGNAAMARISCLWLRCHSHQKVLEERISSKNSCLIRADHLDGISVDIHVY